jgi:hypothetical protein
MRIHSYPIDSLTAGNYLVKIVGERQQDVYFEGSTTIVFYFF